MKWLYRAYLRFSGRICKCGATLFWSAAVEAEVEGTVTEQAICESCGRRWIRELAEFR